MKKSNCSIDSKLQYLFEQMPGCWGCKDKNSVFMYANKEFTHLVGLDVEMQFDIIGMSDFDLPCDMINCAELFRKQDQIVMSTGKKIKILDIHPFRNKEWQAFTVTKVPFFDEKENVIGTIFHALNVTSPAVLELGSILSHISIDSPHALVGGQSSFLLSHQFSEIKLSDREAECLFFILRGKTAKLIGKYLGVSPRTIEEYTSHLKTKFNAQNKCELIAKAIQAGFLSMIPENLLKTQLSVILKEE